MVIDGPSGHAGAGDGPPDRPPERRRSARPADLNVSSQDLTETRPRHHYYDELCFSPPHGTANFGSMMTGRAAAERPEWQNPLSRKEVDRCDGHEFDDDDIAWPQGSGIPLQSGYPAMIEIRDTGGNLRHQQEIASKSFAALRSTGRYRAVYIDDMQKVLDSYSPAE